MRSSRHTQSRPASTGDPKGSASPITSSHSENSSQSASTALYPRAASAPMSVDLPVPDIPVRRMRFTTTASPQFTLGKRSETLFPVGHPDIFHLRGFAQKLLAFALGRVVPVAGVPIIDPGALHVPGRGMFNFFAAFRAAKIPDGLDIIVVGQHLGQRF